VHKHHHAVRTSARREVQFGALRRVRAVPERPSPRERERCDQSRACHRQPILEAVKL
jgi:hypothetical protein